MAISINGARFLAYTVQKGSPLKGTLVVGRQGLFAPPPLLRVLLARHGLPVPEESASFFREEKAEWADPFFGALGAQPLDFLDASDYEGCTRLHDLNRPVPGDWEESTDTLLDSGTLEHVFDVKTAIENYLKLVRVGGSVVLLDMPAVNFCGHGFYQFSPEFFCEVFSERHGFELQTLALAADWGYAPFYRVGRPREVGGRVEVFSDVPCHLFICARKTRPFSGFTRSVNQSDYELAWDRPAPASRDYRSPGRFLDLIRSAWRRIDPQGYWRFSTRRNRMRTLRANSIPAGRNLIPLNI